MVLVFVATTGFGRTVGPAPPIADIFRVNEWHGLFGHTICLESFHCKRIGRIRNIVS